MEACGQNSLQRTELAADTPAPTTSTLASHGHDVSLSSTKLLSSDWMAEHPASRCLTLTEFCFPGTHNSGTCDAQQLNPFVTDVSRLATQYAHFARIAQMVNPVGVREAINSFALCQPGSGSVLQQLLDGGRFLDLRVAFSAQTGSYEMVHTFVVGRLETALHDVRQFVSAHPGEVVLLCVVPRAGIHTLSDHSRLLTFTADRLSEFVFTKACRDDQLAMKSCPTLAKMAEAGQRVVLLYEGPVRHNLDEAGRWFEINEIWLGGHLDTDIVEQKQEFLTNTLTLFSLVGEQSDQPCYLSYTLTPPVRDDTLSQLLDIWLKGAQDGSATLKRLSEKMNPTLPRFLFDSISTASRQKINIITIDFFSEHKDMFLAVVWKILDERVSKKQSSSDQLDAST